MFIVAKSFTNKRGEMFLKIFPNQYPSIETAHAARKKTRAISSLPSAKQLLLSKKAAMSKNGKV